MGTNKSEVKSEVKLTHKQKQFVENYLTNGHNGAKAARDAGYSEKCDHEIAAQNLAKVSINAYMNKRIEEAAHSHGMTMEDIFDALNRGMKYSLPKLEAAKDEKEREEMLRLYSVGDAVKCISEHAKIVGIYAAEKKEHTFDTVNLKDKAVEIENEFEKEY